MEYTAWDKAKSKTHLSISYLESKLGFYSYADESAALQTDRLLAEHLSRRLEEAGSMLGELLNILFELSIDTVLSRKIGLLKDSLEIAADEIGIRGFDWKEPGNELLVRLVLADRQLAEQAAKLCIILRHLVTAAYSARKVRLNDMEAVSSDFMEALSHDIEKADGILEDIIFTFRERETICNLKLLSFEKTFEAVKRGIHRV